MKNKPFTLVIDTIGEGDPGDPTTADFDRQHTIAHSFDVPVEEIQRCWYSMDLTGTTLVAFPGEDGPDVASEIVVQLEMLDQTLRQKGIQLEGQIPLVLLDDGLECCLAINAAFTVAVAQATRTVPQVAGVRYDATHWHLSTYINLDGR